MRQAVKDLTNVRVQFQWTCPLCRTKQYEMVVDGCPSTRIQCALCAKWSPPQRLSISDQQQWDRALKEEAGHVSI